MDAELFNYIFIWVCIVGLCMGSFFNVVILRSLADESIVFPPSKCPKCGNKLKPWHNIPVLSYIFLRGKCAFCKEKISIQYPIIELLTMFLFAFCFWKYQLSWQTLFAITFASGMLIMTVTDLKEKLVDCNIAIFLAILGLVYNWLCNNLLLDSFLGLIVGVLIIELIAMTGHLLKKGRALGEADTYVAGAIGACFGLSNLFSIMVYTLIAATLFVVPIFLYNQYKNNQKTICILFILFTLSALIFKTVLQTWYTFAFLATTGLALTILILRNLRKEATPMYLPFVPALAIGALYFMFF